VRNPRRATAAPRADKLELGALQALVRTFDAIGDEIGGARYPAVAFVKWLADEYAATGRRPSVTSRLTP
jgi:hypothetical protein